MANRRKVIELSTKHLSRAERARKQYEESLVKTESDELEQVAGLLDGAVAKKEYFRILKELQKIDLIGNLDRANMVAYANAYATYMKAHKEIRKKDFEPVITTKQGMKKNPLLNVASDAYAEMCRAGEKLGMSVNARLKAASAKADREEQGLKEMFGDI